MGYNIFSGLGILFKPMQRKIFQPYDFKKGGNQIFLTTGSVRVDILPDNFFVRGHFKSSAGIGFSDEGIAVSKPLTRSTTVGVKGMLFIAAVEPDDIPACGVKFQDCGSSFPALIVEHEQMTARQQGGLMLAKPQV